MKVIEFLKTGVWRMKVSNLSPLKAFGVRFLRLLILVIRGFTKRELQEKASTLTYYTLLSFIPLLAILLAISRGFLLEDTFVRTLKEHFPTQDALISQFLSFAEEAISQTSRKILTGLGIFVFLWSTFKILNHLEYGLNQIFHVKEERSFIRRVSDYLAVIFLCPLFLSLSTAITFRLSSKVPLIEHVPVFAQEVSGVFYFFLNVLSYLLISFLFTFLYLFLGNVKIAFFAAFTGGIIAGLIYQIFQVTYIYLQSMFTESSASVGTIAAIPLFLIWMQFSWLILLLGAKITFSLQNIDAYEFLVEKFSLSYKYRKILSLIIVHHCIKEFCEAKTPPLPIEISTKLKLPHALAVSILEELVQARILSEVKHPKKDELGYQPALEVDQLSIKKVLDMLNENGDSIPLPATAEVKKIMKSLDSFSQLIEKSPQNVLLKDM